MPILTATLSFCVSLLLGAQQPAATDEMRRSEFTSVALSQHANREAFRFGTFSFEFTKGSSDSNADALAGRFSVAYTATGLYAFDGKNSRFERNYRPEDLAAARKKTGPNGYRSPIVPVRLLCDGEVTLLDRPGLIDSDTSLTHSAMIHAGTRIFVQEFQFPLWVGQDARGPSDLMLELDRLKEGTCSIKEIDFHSQFDGVAACKVVVDFGGAGRNYWVDMHRGAVTIRAEDWKGSEVTHIDTYKDVEFVPGAGWLPMTERFVMLGGKVAHQTRITNVEVQHKPGPSAFQLEFPTAMDMHDEARKLKYGPSKTWSLLQLPGRGSSDAKPFVVKSFVPPPDMAGEVKPGGPWAAVFFAVAGALAIVVLARFIMRRLGRERVA